MSPLIDELVADLKPVKRLGAGALAQRLGAAVAVSLLLMVVGLGARHDWAEALQTSLLWWNIGCMAVTGLSSAALLYIAALPGRPPMRWPIAGLAVGFGAMLTLGLLHAAAHPAQALALAHGPMDGLKCAGWIALTSAPPLVACIIFARRAAPVRPTQTALLTGLASASFGAMVFALHCPEDNPVHVAVWHLLTVAAVTVIARLLLARRLRW